MNILIIYSTFTTKSNWVDSLYSFEKYSDHKVFYFNARLFNLPSFVNAVAFDLIIFHTLFFNQRWNEFELQKTFIKSLHETLLEEQIVNITDSSGWKALSDLVGKSLIEFRDWVLNSNNPIVGYGAAAKAVTLLSAAQIPRDSILFCIDNSEG